MWQITKCELIINNICIEITNDKTNEVFIHNIIQSELKTCSTKQLFNLLTKIIQGIKTPGLEIEILNICKDRVALKIIFSTMEINETINLGKTLDSYHIILKDEIIKLHNEIVRLREENNLLKSNNNFNNTYQSGFPFERPFSHNQFSNIPTNSEKPPECVQS